MEDKEKAEATAKRKRQDQKIIWKSNWISLLGVVVFLGLGYVFLGDVPSPHQEQLTHIKNRAETVVYLDMFQDEEAKTALDHIPSVGEVLTFRVSANQPVHAALLASVDSGRPLILLEDQRIPPIQNLILKRQNTRYTYTVARNAEHITICLMYADDRKQLIRKLQSSNYDYMNGQLDNCVHW